MNIKDITYFVEVANTKNFTKAANNLHISQPGLSKAIKMLEYETNTKLIERSAKNFKLTDEGETFYENAQKALEIINLQMLKLEDSLKCCKKKLTVGLPPVIGTTYFTSVVASFKKEYDDIEIRIVEEGSHNIKDKVKDETVDIGAVILPVYDDELISVPITDGDVMLVVNKEHKFSNRDVIDVSELRGEKFITFNHNFMMYDKTINACKECGFEPNIVQETSQWDFIIEMVSLNQGITIMPKPIVKRFKTDDIKLIRIENPQITWDVGFVLKKDRYISNSMKTFIKYVEEIYEKEH